MVTSMVLEGLILYDCYPNHIGDKEKFSLVFFYLAWN